MVSTGMFTMPTFADVPSDIEDDGPLPSIPPTPATAAASQTAGSGVSGGQSSGRPVPPAAGSAVRHTASSGAPDPAKRTLEESIFGDLSDLDAELSQQTGQHSYTGCVRRVSN